MVRIKLERDPTPPERTKRTAEHICELLDICPNSTCFQFQGKLGRENAQLCNGITTLSPQSGQAVQRQIHLPQELQFHSWTLAKTKKRKTYRNKSRKKRGMRRRRRVGISLLPSAISHECSDLNMNWTTLAREDGKPQMNYIIRTPKSLRYSYEDNTVHWIVDTWISSNISLLNFSATPLMYLKH